MSAGARMEEVAERSAHEAEAAQAEAEAARAEAEAARAEADRMQHEIERLIVELGHNRDAIEARGLPRALRCTPLVVALPAAAARSAWRPTRRR